MATISKTQSNTYKVLIRKNGFPAQIKTFKTKTEAQKWARLIESEIDRGVFIDRTEADKTTVGELIDRYIQEVTPLKRSARNDKQRMLFLKRHFGHFIVSQLQSKHIASYRDKRLAEGKQGATVVKEIGSMSHLLDIAIKDWSIPLTSNVATLVRKPRQSKGRDRRLVDDEEQILIQAAKNSKSPLLPSIIIIALETGMRLGELLSLEWQNIDLKKQTALLPITKNGESRTVPLSRRAVDTLHSIPRIPRKLNNQRVFWTWAKSDCFQHTWRRMLSQTEIKNLRFHDLRHEACSRFFEKGFNIMETAHISGHKTLQQLKRYTHLKAEDIVVKLNACSRS
ncbi:Site-specific recombinase XerD [Nitrosomonas aestuarii]|uniref:Site-specific recombinase XerD n=1 Tax=Nitrosomonas aestuarii TaxID=52441 RepID=A0A1I4D3Y8_9PROT|nr:site-specific integrase [Nitrosomonas aestuarii]SFK87479.1 Site-specific recombinase XerD [Nitrosomonas aestuarii]